MDKWEVKVWLAVAHGARDKSVCMPDRYASIYRDGYVSGIYGVLEWLGHKVEVELDPNRIDLEWIHKTRKDIDRVVDREVRRVLNLD